MTYYQLTTCIICTLHLPIYFLRIYVTLTLFHTFACLDHQKKPVLFKLKRASKRDFHYACIIECPTELELLPTQGPLVMYLS